MFLPLSQQQIEWGCLVFLYLNILFVRKKKVEEILNFWYSFVNSQSTSINKQCITLSFTYEEIFFEII